MNVGGQERSEGQSLRVDAPVYSHNRSVSVKSCNECRQQKARIFFILARSNLAWIGKLIFFLLLQLRCDVVKQPFSSCSRCRRLCIDCKIDSSFKRIGKRKYSVLDVRSGINLTTFIANMRSFKKRSEIYAASLQAKRHLEGKATPPFECHSRTVMQLLILHQL